MSDLSLDLMPDSWQLLPDLLPVTDDADLAIGRIADTPKRTLMAEKLRLSLQGTWTVITVSHRCRPVGFVAVKPAGDDAQLVFGHVLPTYTGDRKDILKALAGLLTGRGFKVIRSIFAWPEPEKFVEAAPAAGFLRLDRMDMIREDAGRPAGRMAPTDVEIVRWSPEHFEDVARIMHENYYPQDRIINPAVNTLDGCRTHLRNIISDCYGAFTPGRSFVALREGKAAGYVLTSAGPGGDALVVELAVDRASRGRGVASAMMGSLIEGMAGKGRIVLTVTLSNRDAIRLYERMGFRDSAAIAYYVLVPETSSPDGSDVVL